MDEDLPLYQHHSDTSEAAFRSQKSSAKRKAREAIYRLLGKQPSTDEQMQKVLRIAPSTQRPRRVELVEEGLVVDSGDRVKTESGRQATVWRLRDPGAPLPDRPPRTGGKGWRYRAQQAERQLAQLADAGRALRRATEVDGGATQRVHVPYRPYAKFLAALDAVDGTNHADPWANLLDT